MQDTELHTLRQRLAESEKDKTERKQAEEALLDSENELKWVADQALAGMYILQNGVFRYVNARFAQMFGYTVDECLNDMYFQNLVYAEDVATVEEQVRRRTSGEVESVHYTFRGLKKNGQIFHAEVYGATSVYKGEPAGAGTILDITERKLAEKALAESEGKYRRIVETANEGVCMADADYLFTYVNQKMADMLGYLPEEIIGKPLGHFLFSEDMVNHQEKRSHRIEGLNETYERRFRRSDGGECWAKVSATAIRSDDGRFMGSFAMLTDITESKRAEEEIRQSNAYLENILDNSPDAIAIVDKHGRIIRWNKMAEDLYGYTFEEMNGKTGLDLYADKGQLEKMLVSLRREGSVKKWEMRMERKDGSIAPFEISIGFLKDSQKETLGSVCVARDLSEIKETLAALRASNDQLNQGIFERKRAEETLRKAEAEYRTIFENTGMATIILEEDTTISLANAEFEKLTGYTRDEIENKRRWTEFVVKEDLERMLYQHRLRRADAKAALKQYEFRIIDKHDQIRDCLLTVDMIAGTKRSIASFLDITERRQTEQKAAQLAAIVESSDDAIIGKNLDGSITSWNRGAEKIYGYAASEVIGKPISILFASGLEDDAKQILEKIKSGEPVEHYETVRRRKDGRDIHMSLTVSSIRNYKGIIVAASTIGRDITDRKQAEDALQQSEEQFRTLVESAPDAIFIEVGGRFVYLNDAAIHMYGAASEEELSGHAIIGRIHPDHRANVLERIRFIDEERKPTPLMELKHVKLDGTTVYAESHAVPIKYRKSKAALVFVRDITERKKNEEALSISEERYRRLFEDASMGIFRVTLEGKLIDVNPAFTLMFGFDSQEEVKSQVNDVAVDLFVDPSRRHEIVRMMLDTKRPVHAESLYRRKDGSTFTADLHAWAVRDKEGKLLYLEGFVEDISERKRAKEEKEKLEAQLFQAQKMESVGRLAGGVAHDFNNMLGVIIGRAEMALQQDVSNDKLKHHLDEILKAALRSADLTKQLLAFARKQTAVPKILSLNDTISGMLQMLRRLIGEDIDLLWGPELDLWKVKIDPSQVDQILANLAVNARDAISGVGAITLRTENVVIDDSNWADTPEFIPGEYVLLTVSDNGSGMSEEVRSNIFEPFFTTKEIGKGTGLGLSTVYGIVKQNDGFIYVESEPGKGTTFKIYLPRFEAETAHVPSGEINVKRLTGTETILLVEDDEAILDLGKMILENLGYTVLAAQTVVDSISLVKEHPGDIHLVITDVVMPEMNGRELAEKLRVIRPNLKCLYMSGYTADVIAHRGILDGGLNFIQKPFRRDDLAAKVRQVLDHLG
ncbi:MAG: PAS domain S-box protein [Syntrophobacteraceae bacterium]